VSPNRPPERLIAWSVYGHTSEATLGNAAWKILAGETDAATLVEQIERCAYCRQLAELVPRHEGHLLRGCWHQAARLLLEQGLQPLPRE
jgi:hypothetical protein